MQDSDTIAPMNPINKEIPLVPAKRAHSQALLGLPFDLVAMLLVGCSILGGWQFWCSWFSTIDRVICAACSLAGLVWWLSHSSWQYTPEKTRIKFVAIAWAGALVLVGLCFAKVRPELGNVALGFVLAGWLGVRGFGERISHACFIGLLSQFPIAIEQFSKYGGFNWLESAAVDMTAVLANSLKQPYAREGTTVLFEYGIANRFSCIGNWDSLVSLLGITLFGIFAFRRNLLTAISSVVATVTVWLFVRSSAWVVLALASSIQNAWLEWSLSLEIMLFIVSSILVVALNRLMPNVFEPIPFDFFSVDSPILFFLWNWLCGLPNPVMRIPKDNRISSHWRMHLRSLGKKSTTFTDFYWVCSEMRHMVFNPVELVGGLNDLSAGWIYSRKWKRFWVYVIPLLVPITVVLLMGSSLIKRTNQTIHLLTDTSEQLCPTVALEVECFQKQEEGFRMSMGLQPSDYSKSNSSPISRQTKRAELLSKRILALEPENVVARYRIGLIHCLNGEPELARIVMTHLGSSQSGNFPQANAWLAKDLIMSIEASEDASNSEIFDHIEKGRKWKGIDYRLLLRYFRELEKRGNTMQAVSVAKQAAAIEPDMLLTLAQLYKSIGHEDLERTANQSKMHFVEKLKVSNEMESDRLAAAKSMMLLYQFADAEKILTEGILSDVLGEEAKKLLSEIQISLYRKSIRIKQDGTCEVDLSLLEKAAEADPMNPEVSLEIAKLLSRKMSPPKSLLECLKEQIKLNLVTSDSHLEIADSLIVGGKTTGASMFLEYAVKKDPVSIPVLANVAHRYVKLVPPNLRRSYEILSQALTLDPANADTLDAMGELLMSANRPMEAIKKFEQSLQINADRVETRKKIVEAYLAVGLKDKANEQLDAMEKLTSQDQLLLDFSTP